MAFSGTPFQRALPMAPFASWPPATRGSTNPRLLPEHWLTATISIGSKLVFKSWSERESGVSTLPPIAIR